MAHPTELRARVFDAYGKETTPVAKLAERFGVSRSSLYNWRWRMRQSGSLQRSASFGGRRPKLDAQTQEQLRALLQRKPGQSLAQLCVELQAATGISLSRSSLSRALRKMGLSPSKRRMATEDQS